MIFTTPTGHEQDQPLRKFKLYNSEYTWFMPPKLVKKNIVHTTTGRNCMKCTFVTYSDIETSTKLQKIGNFDSAQTMPSQQVKLHIPHYKNLNYNPSSHEHKLKNQL